MALAGIPLDSHHLQIFCVSPHWNAGDFFQQVTLLAEVSHHPTNGITFVSGGKWTTWREMAEDGVEQVIQRHPELKKKALRGQTGDGLQRMNISSGCIYIYISSM